MPSTETGFFFKFTIYFDRILAISSSPVDGQETLQTNGGEDILLYIYIYIYMDVSENSGTPKTSILIGFSIINHPFWGTTILGNPRISS